MTQENNHIKKEKRQIWGHIYKYALIVILLTAVAYRGGRSFVFQKKSVEVNVEMKNIKDIFPTAENFETNRQGMFDVFAKDGEKIGTAILSTNYYQKSGYAGIVPLLIGVDNNLIITKISLLPNNETLEYTDEIHKDEFIGRWNGVSIKDASSIEIDAVSGATYTSNAVIYGVKYTTSSITNSDASSINEKKKWTIIKDFIFLSLVLLSIAMAYIKGAKKYRLVYLFLVLIIMGIIMNNSLSTKLLYGWLLDGFSWRANWQTVLVFLLSVIISFVGKRKFYCNYLCPMGALQELASNLSPFKKRNLPTKFLGISVNEIYLTLISGALVLGFAPPLSYLEPFMFFSYKIVGIGLIIFGTIVLISSLFFKKPWCAVCPTGCLLDTVSHKPSKNKSESKE